ncbi:TM0106 family RecB-like putative nuclease [Mesorhizobium sp. M1E.F.Ca.ET.041.01.1.1]|uniref:TM0106 family RecB-like putative nuclease n=1 Tax=Mesorhizobium sp. M1E.F.Ca.ET.041.01.1.1 TaxID=2496759 RepID=UPI000FCAA9AE|nr:TM0106 family RecB-like putative nuclease [Mesorhizobium sp. M1E.F.Ca.ET.041.01.1.1]RUW37689.1 TM0106 family RecB-like putative nuclease [Mesorhizobium sp. M1E.F.Ca.ET.041.01.1.1]
MKLEGSEILLSASDLMRFMGCIHATAMDLRYAKGEPLSPAEDTEDAKILQKQGDAHEAKFLAKLRAEGHRVIEFGRDRDLPAAAKETRAALFAGADVLFQGAFFGPPWGGWSDFLIKVDKPSLLGAYSYEVIDTKLKRKPDPKHILQLVLYSDLLAKAQGLQPEYAHIELGNGERFSFRLLDYAAYARHARSRLERFVADPPATSPDPVKMCDLCRWREVCQTHWEESDSLALVAGISRSQRSKLIAAGVTTMAALGQHNEGVPKLAETTLSRLRTQARLQTARRAGGRPSFELKPFDPSRGLALLPKPDAGDLFYDIEGDPFYEDGLEYLHGVWFGSRGSGEFRDFWAHNRTEEKEALRQLMVFFEDRLKRFPRAHIYHYAAYEVSALRQLTSSHGVGEALLDQMLRENRFIDLYSVVSAGLIASEPRYSLKNLEVFYMEARTGEVKTAGGSVVAYEKWRETGDQSILDEIRDYNRVDCISTQLLRDWLIAEVRPPNMEWRDRGGADEGAGCNLERAAAEQAAADELRERLRPVRAQLGDRLADLLFDLSYFHPRERKPAWWSIFDKIGREADELVDDLDCLGGLEAVSATSVAGRYWQRTYEFPAQETKIDVGDCHIEVDGLPSSAKLIEIDRTSNRAVVQFSINRYDDAPESTCLVPAGPLDTRTIEGAIQRAVASIVRDDRQFPAILDFLQRSRPRFLSHGRQSNIIDPSSDVVPEIITAVGDLDRSTVAVQGPPGTGKTYVSSCAILDLVKRGKRIAVASNSHNAIDNLLCAVVDRANEAGTSVAIAKKGGDGFDDPYGSIYVTSKNEDSQLITASVVGGTAWLLSRPEFQQAFDYLFVDEAGQVSVANIVAMGTCAKNIVLVGDPMQLPQPIQGAHPGESGLSSLEYLLAGHNTVPADMGIFLPISRRMHPDVCRFISDIIYESRLASDEGAARQAIISDANRSSGVHFVEVQHSGNRQVAVEETDAIRREMDRLIGVRFRDRDGKERSLTLQDILIVAPYNAQVNALRRSLPPGSRIGTVDKFQGQEAPVCMVSMTTSSADEIPRGVDFLFSLNRINVAVSRAQVLALVFANPRLLEVHCHNVHEMRLVSMLCSLREYSGSHMDSGPPVTSKERAA